MQVRPVVLQLPGMEKVKVTGKVTYKTLKDTNLYADIYYPPGFDNKSNLPIVIYNNGVGAIDMPQWRVYQDWCRLTAVGGMIAVIYQSRLSNPKDSEDLIDFLRANADRYHIDAQKIGIWTCSGNASVGIPLMQQPERDYIRCGVIYYGFAQGAAAMVRRTDLPLFVVRAGMDAVRLNQGLEAFVANAVNHDVDVTYINYTRGSHAFDILDNNDQSKEIIRQALAFMEVHLNRSTYPKNEAVMTPSNLRFRLLNATSLEKPFAVYEAVVQKYSKDTTIIRFYNHVADPGTLTQIAYEFMAQKKNDFALQAFRFNRKLFPDDANTYDSMGDYFESVGQADSAVYYSERALEFVDKSPLNEFFRNQIIQSAEGKINRLKKK